VHLGQPASRVDSARSAVLPRRGCIARGRNRRDVRVSQSGLVQGLQPFGFWCVDGLPNPICRHRCPLPSSHSREVLGHAMERAKSSRNTVVDLMPLLRRRPFQSSNRSTVIDERGSAIQGLNRDPTFSSVFRAVRGRLVRAHGSKIWAKNCPKVIPAAPAKPSNGCRPEARLPRIGWHCSRASSELMDPTLPNAMRRVRPKRAY